MGKMVKVLLCVILLNGGFVYSQLTSTVRNVHLVGHIPYMQEVVETFVRDMVSYEWCNLKVPGFTADVDSKTANALPMPTLRTSMEGLYARNFTGCFIPTPEHNTDASCENVFDWHVKGKVTFSEAFVTAVQHVDIIQSTVQQIWRFNNTDSTASVFVQATVRLVELTLGYDIHFESEDGNHYYYTATFKHNLVQFPFAIIYNLITEELSATVTMTTLPRSTNKVVFAPLNPISEVLSHQYDVTSAGPGIADWAANVFEPILLNVATYKVPFPQICYNCAA